jgi:hypothetical protein
MTFVLLLLLAGGTLRQVGVVVTGFTLGHSVTLSLGVLGMVRHDGNLVEALVGASIVVVGVENLSGRGGRDWVLPLGLLLGLAVVSALLLPSEARRGVAVLGVAIAAAGYFAWPRGEAGEADALQTRTAVAALFGLVHGLAFAGALTEMQLPAGAFARALFGFNSGVELGQLAVVVAGWVVLRRLAAGWQDVLSAVGVALGTFWFIGRVFP